MLLRLLTEGVYSRFQNGPLPGDQLRSAGVPEETPIDALTYSRSGAGSSLQALREHDTAPSVRASPCGREADSVGACTKFYRTECNRKQLTVTTQAQTRLMAERDLELITSRRQHILEISGQAHQKAKVGLAVVRYFAVFERHLAASTPRMPWRTPQAYCIASFFLAIILFLFSSGKGAWKPRSRTRILDSGSASKVRDVDIGVAYTFLAAFANATLLVALICVHVRLQDKALVLRRTLGVLARSHGSCLASRGAASQTCVRVGRLTSVAIVLCSALYFFWAPYGQQLGLA
eukprot:scaffold1277_cov329-Prasinococcus_capsulatus_cf.AAC.5